MPTFCTKSSVIGCRKTERPDQLSQTDQFRKNTKKVSK